MLPYCSPRAAHRQYSSVRHSRQQYIALYPGHSTTKTRSRPPTQGKVKGLAGVGKWQGAIHTWASNRSNSEERIGVPVSRSDASTDKKSGEHLGELNYALCHFGQFSAAVRKFEGEFPVTRNNTAAATLALSRRVDARCVYVFSEANRSSAVRFRILESRSPPNTNGAMELGRLGQARAVRKIEKASRPKMTSGEMVT